MLGWSLFVSTVFLLITPAVSGFDSQTQHLGISPDFVLALLGLAYATHVVVKMVQKLQDKALCR
ncbi:hypothetical protein L9G15_09760 [Shewanella sp. A3A]|uniref:Uncharacterized protein n=1 Tax=Shewanella electrica TaxID=515560 RepID=A0ABT2FP81_9GAMM|nr:hypothetical protein [Shewanella electrica]MCH1919719.1 hypothetical protein [Shewanella ferrihydritica]MCH1923793.1 hypothetical protein [Shewanella electrica]MCS4557011.1 hypothetical protein [Shewanella electrica]